MRLDVSNLRLNEVAEIVNSLRSREFGLGFDGRRVLLQEEKNETCDRKDLSRALIYMLARLD